MSNEEVREMTPEDMKKVRAKHKADHNQPLKLNSRHRRLMYALVSGMNNTAAGEVVGMTPERVGQLKNSALFKNEMARLHSEIRGMVVENEATRYDRTQAMNVLDDEVGRSIEKLVELRDGADSEGVVLKSAMDLLDRAGVKKVVGVEAKVSIEAGDGVVSMLQQVMQVPGVEVEGSDDEEVVSKDA